MSSENPTVIGLFAGVGGIEIGLSQAGFATLVANEIDAYASKTYGLNHKHPLIEGDIKDLSAREILHATELEQLPAHTLIAGGFPCQPFSVAGYRKGFDDERGNVFWEILRLMEEVRPDVVFLENVKNLEGHDAGNTFRTIQAALRGEVASPSGTKLSEPYFVKSAVLNSKDFGVPQNRERIYIVGFRSEAAYSAFRFPKPEDRKTADLGNFIDFETKVEDKYYYDERRPFFTKLVDQITEPGVIYQWRRQYVRANKSGVCPTLTANMGMGGHNVPLIWTQYGIRKLTPRECFNLMGYPGLRFPEGVAESRLYKQAGNSVVVPVIKAIGLQIKHALHAAVLAPGSWL